MRNKMASNGRKIINELSGLKMRRSPNVEMYFRRGHLIVENYITRLTFQVDLNAVTLLSYFSGWRTPSEVSRTLIGYTRKSVLRSVQNLKERGLLITKDSDEAKLEDKFGEEWLWPIASRFYHFSTKIDDPHNTPKEVMEDYSRFLKTGDFRERCIELTAGHAWTKNASALFIMTAVVARTAWKYRTPRVYRAFLLDAGHLSQSFLLVATALGLGGFCLGTICDKLIEKELDLDGISETALFVVGVGQPVRSSPRPGRGLFHDHFQPKDRPLHETN